MIRIGKIVATHGVQGDMVIKHVVGNSKWLKKEEVLFLELRKESYIPFFTTDIRGINDDEYIIRLEDIPNVEEAKKLVGKEVYVKEEVLKDHAEDTPLLWKGFNLVDKNKGSLGAIEEVMEVGPQWLAKITYQDKEVLIPLAEDFLIEINMKNKFVRIELPEGLIEVYTQG
jgi:16S rRNA processing protein RimM